MLGETELDLSKIELVDPVQQDSNNSGEPLLAIVKLATASAMQDSTCINDQFNFHPERLTPAMVVATMYTILYFLISRTDISMTSTKHLS